MKIHSYFQGGPFDGAMVTLFHNKEAKKEIRVARASNLEELSEQYQAEVYALIDVAAMPQLGASHIMAGYRHAGSKKTAVSLIDFFFRLEYPEQPER